MSTPFALEAERVAYDRRVVRVVEAQHRIATNRLAATPQAQQLLEDLADAVKPELPREARALPWLLASPFRYGLGRPSRFRSADTLPGIFYASEEIETAITEAAHWRLAAFARSPGMLLPRTPTPVSAFSVRARSASAIDLTRGTLAAREAEWTAADDYAATQRLAAEARHNGVALIRARSARRRTGMNVAVFDPAALIPPPRPHSSWSIRIDEGEAIATRELSLDSIRYRLPA